MSRLADLAWDCYRFFLTFQGGIDQAPLQVYISASLFTPAESFVKSFVDELVSGQIATVFGKNNNWEPYLQLINGNQRWGAQFTYSSDALQVFIQFSGHIEVRDTATNTCLRIIDLPMDEKSHFKEGLSIRALSLDCSLLANTSSVSDVPLRLLDVAEERWRDFVIPVSGGDEVNIWNATTQEVEMCHLAPEYLSYESKDADISPSEDIVTLLSRDGCLYLWTLTKRKWLQPSEMPFRRVLFLHDGRFLATATREARDALSHIWIWNTSSFTVCASYEVSNRAWTSISSLAFAPDSTYLISTQTNSRERDNKTWPLKGLGHEKMVTSTRVYVDESDNAHRTYHPSFVAFSPDGKWLGIATGGSNVDLWTSAGLFERNLIKLGSEDAVRSIFFSWDSRFIAVGTDRGKIHLGSTSTGIPAAALVGSSDAPTAIAFSRDTKRWCPACEGTIRVFDIKQRVLEGADSPDDYRESRQIWTITGFPHPSFIDNVAMAMLEDLVMVASRSYGMGLLNKPRGKRSGSFSTLLIGAL